MKPIPCLNCQIFFTPRNRKQNYCSDPECQRARKALWQKEKMASDPEYEKGQKLSQEKWLQSNPDYYEKYRQKNPDKVKRNRCLQKIRNQRKRKGGESVSKDSNLIGIAKMDARKSSIDKLSGEYVLIPMVAKMDPIKILILTKPISYK